MPLHGKIVVIKRGGGDGTEFPLTASCLFGRKPDCDIRIQLPQVSKEHCRVELNENQEVVLTNLSTANPTRVNGEPLQQSERLKHGDIITIIDRSFRFEYPPTPTPKKRRPSLTGKPETLQVLQDQQLRDSTAGVDVGKKILPEDGATPACMELDSTLALGTAQPPSPFSDLYHMIKQSLDTKTPRKPPGAVQGVGTPAPGMPARDRPRRRSEGSGGPQRVHTPQQRFSVSQVVDLLSQPEGPRTPDLVPQEQVEPPRTSPRVSPMVSPRTSPRVSPMVSTRTSPRVSPRILQKKLCAQDVLLELEAAAVLTGQQKRRTIGGLLPRGPVRSKRVSFGGQLSPELFDKRLPPDSPLRRGATPRRSLCVSAARLLKVKSPSKQPGQKSPGRTSPSSVAHDRTPALKGRFSVSRIATPSPPAAQAATPPPLRRRSVKSTPQRTPRSAAKSTTTGLRRKSSVSRASMKATWVDVVKFGQVKAQVIAPARKPTKTKKVVVPKPKTPARRQDYAGTGHADSPATIVVGRAHTQRLGQPPGGAPCIVPNVAVLKESMAMDKDLTGVAEIFSTPVTTGTRRRTLLARSSPRGALSSSMEVSLMSTPGETGEMLVSPLGPSAALSSYCSQAVQRLLQAPQEHGATPRNKPPQADCLTGVKRLLKTPRQKAEPVEDLWGRLLKTPRPAKAPEEVDLDGVRELLETLKGRKQPVESLVMMQTPTTIDTPSLQTPTLETFPNIETPTLQTPTILETSTTLETSSPTLETFTTIDTPTTLETSSPTLETPTLETSTTIDTPTTLETPSLQTSTLETFPNIETPTLQTPTTLETSSPTLETPTLETFTTIDTPTTLETSSPTLETPTLETSTTIDTPTTLETPSLQTSTLETFPNIETPTLQTPTTLETPTILETPTTLETPTLETTTIDTPTTLETSTTLQTPTTLETSSPTLETLTLETSTTLQTSSVEQPAAPQQGEKTPEGPASDMEEEPEVACAMPDAMETVSQHLLEEGLAVPQEASALPPKPSPGGRAKAVRARAHTAPPMPPTPSAALPLMPRRGRKRATVAHDTLHAPPELQVSAQVSLQQEEQPRRGRRAAQKPAAPPTRARRGQKDVSQKTPQETSLIHQETPLVPLKTPQETSLASLETPLVPQETLLPPPAERPKCGRRARPPSPAVCAAPAQGPAAPHGLQEGVLQSESIATAPRRRGRAKAAPPVVAPPAAPSSAPPPACPAASPAATTSRRSRAKAAPPAAPIVAPPPASPAATTSRRGKAKAAPPAAPIVAPPAAITVRKGRAKAVPPAARIVAPPAAITVRKGRAKAVPPAAPIVAPPAAPPPAPPAAITVRRGRAKAVPPAAPVRRIRCATTPPTDKSPVATPCATSGGMRGGAESGRGGRRALVAKETVSDGDLSNRADASGDQNMSKKSVNWSEDLTETCVILNTTPIKATRGRKSKLSVDQTEASLQAVAKRGRQSAEPAEPAVARRGRQSAEPAEPAVAKRGRQSAEPAVARRGRQSAEPAVARRGRQCAEPVEPAAVKRGRQSAEPAVARRGRQSAEPTEPAAVKRGRQSAEPAEPAVARRGRQSTEPAEPAAVKRGPAKRKGKKEASEAKEEALSAGPVKRARRRAPEEEGPSQKGPTAIELPARQRRGRLQAK